MAALARHNASTPPISRLSTEILAGIFVHFECLCRAYSFAVMGISEGQAFPFR